MHGEPLARSAALKKLNSTPRRADAGKRALNVWLRRNCDPGLQELLSKHGITLHSPVGTHDYQFDRAALRECVRLNFKVSERWIAEVEPKGRHLVQMVLMSRCERAARRPPA